MSAAVAMFNTPSERVQALLVPLFYGLMEAFMVGLYCFVAGKLGWTKAPRDASFCSMLVTTYELDDDDESIQSLTPDQSMDEIDDVEVQEQEPLEVEWSDSISHKRSYSADPEFFPLHYSQKDRLFHHWTL